jgi:hypothetical protein
MWMASLLLAFQATPSLAQEAYVTVDSFAAGPINGNLWSQLDRDRVVAGSALNMTLREAGGIDSDSGSKTVSWGQGPTLPQSISQLKAQLRVNGYDVGSCAANPGTSRVRARLFGTFFNTGNPLSGSNVGDMFAQIRVYRDSDSADPPGVMRVDALVTLCQNADCSEGRGVGGVPGLGTVNVGQNIVLQIEWDKANKKFVFARDNYAQTAEVGYTQSDASQPGRGYRSIGLRTDLENCAGGPQVFGSIDARFDNVSVNSRAKP